MFGHTELRPGNIDAATLPRKVFGSDWGAVLMMRGGDGGGASPQDVAGIGCAIWLAALIVTGLVAWLGSVGFWWWFWLILSGIALAVYVNHVGQQILKTSLPSDDDEPETIRFSYVNAKGGRRIHELSNWTVNGDYLEGADINSGEFKTYRLDRVQDWYSARPRSLRIKARIIP